jgi:hypothetical protein
MNLWCTTHQHSVGEKKTEIDASMPEFSSAQPSEEEVRTTLLRARQMSTHGDYREVAQVQAAFYLSAQYGCLLSLRVC